MIIFALFIALLNMSLFAKCDNFCDPQKNDNLLDVIFNFDRDIYVFRRPNHIWLLNLNGNSIWTQVGDHIQLSQLFTGKPLNTSQI